MTAAAPLFTAALLAALVGAPVAARVSGAGHPDFVGRAAVTILSPAEFQRQRNADWRLAAALARSGPRPLTFKGLDRKVAFFTTAAKDEGGAGYEATLRFVADLDGAWRLRLD